MRRIVQLTHDIFTDEKAVNQTVELLKKRDGDTTFILFPQAHVEDLFGALASVPFSLEARSYERGEGKVKAALWAKELDASVVEQWTLVKGVYTADPRIVEQAEIIEHLNYQEAQELASAGISVLDRKALSLLEENDVELHIRSVFHAHEHVGTIINAQGSERSVKALSHIPNVALVSLTGVAFHGVAGVDARAFTALAGAGINVRLVSQASSERSLGVVVDQENASKAQEVLINAFSKEEATVSITEGLTILNIVGRHNYALERAIYELRRNNIWLHLIANSVEGHQISLVLNGGTQKKALDLVHSQLLGQLKRLNVFCFGKGLVGGTFIRQVLESSAHVREKRKLDVRLIGVADSKRSIFTPAGLPENWHQLLSESTENNDPRRIAEALALSGLSNLVIVDNTAEQSLTDYYPLFVESGCDLVASNKKANARDQQYYDELRILLERKGKSFKYETNVGAGLPLVDTLLQLHHSRDRITRIKGVFSGSMSFLFNTYSESDRAFTSVLNEAQLSGYTEPDPREDLNGMDVARKLLILARTVDVRAELSDVSIQNLIPTECQEDVPYDAFKSHFPALDAYYGDLKQNLAPNHVLRYVGDLAISDAGEATLSVALVEVPKASPLGGIQGSDSLFEIYTEGYGDHPMVIQGAGAGAEVTARGVYSDVLRLG